MRNGIDVDAVRRRLAARLSILLARGERIDAHQRGLGREVPSAGSDRAQSREDDEVVEGLDALTRADVARLRDALARIAEGTWGTCGACGAAISAERLEALPEADTCERCSS